jgi:hypothetical protein
LVRGTQSFDKLHEEALSGELAVKDAAMVEILE